MNKNENGFSIFFEVVVFARYAAVMSCLMFLAACSTPRLWKNPHKGLADDLTGSAKARASAIKNRSVANKYSDVDSSKHRLAESNEADRDKKNGRDNEYDSNQANVNENDDIQAKSEDGLEWPTSPVVITSPFGKRGRHAHEGVDLKASVGTEVYAAGDGIVVYSGTRIRGYGKLIVIKHGNDLATVYGHCSESRVVKNQRVRKGDLIALSGQTGRASGPHLHFEVRKGVDAIDPVAFFSGNSVRVERTLASSSFDSSGSSRTKKSKTHVNVKKNVQKKSAGGKKNAKVAKSKKSKKTKRDEKVVKI